MKVCFTVWLLSVAAGCSVNNSAKTADIQNGNTTVPSITSKALEKNPPVQNVNLKTTVFKNGDSKTVDCDDPNGFRLVVVPDPERPFPQFGVGAGILNIIAGDETKVAIKVPSDSGAQNFVLSPPEKTKEGFEITIDYGTRYYYQKQFNFICKEGNFYLNKVRVVSFDKFDPVSRDNWDRKEIKINPNLPVEKFSIFDYLLN
jgi:hypothetical protein